MNFTIYETPKGRLGLLNEPEARISGVQDALDMLAEANYNENCTAILLPKQNLPEEFFELRTRLAGEMLEKFVQYQMKLAIIGDFSGYTSKALADFIRESNQGGHILFLPSVEAAVAAFA